MYTRILGTGSAFPVTEVTNDDMAKRIDTSDEWITTRTGIKSRRIANSDEDVISLGIEAGRKAIEMAGVQSAKIDMLICATTSSPHSIPSAACIIQRELNLPGIPAFDMAAACSGFIYGLSIADQYIKSGMCRNVLVIGSDTLNRLCDPNDRNTVVLFGDGAGAVLVGASDEQGIISTHLHADGNYANLLGAAAPKRGEIDVNREAYMYMKGSEVFKIAVSKLSDVVVETLEANNVAPDDLDWLVPHQANLRIIKATAKKLNMSMDKVVVNLDKYGNTSAATIPTALDEAVRDGRIKRGHLLLLEAFGSGFAWGSALVRF